jgi:serine protease
MRPKLVLPLLLLTLSASALAAEENPVRRHPIAAPVKAESQRVIVKLRVGDSTSRVQAQSMHDRMSTLAVRAGLSLKKSLEIAPSLQALQVEPAVFGESLDETLARLRADPDVEFAEPDQRRYPHAVPDDPLFADQWYFQKSETSAVNAGDAWDTTVGAANIVIAVVDTGVRFEHPDLQRVSQGGRLLDGYDFVSADSNNVFLTANDGNGRDTDASDPGDWVDANDQQTSQFSDCDTGSSSWHGTRVSGIIGARANNTAGIAGGTWAPLLLPVRALGKCGGYDSDVIAAIRWAAGLSVSGAPTNTHPAKIINLSLGATGACPTSYQNTFNELNAMGVLVVVSAGNENGHAVDSPANCSGVLGVAGLRHVGTKVGYSNIGTQIGISAPGGNCGTTNPSLPCQYSLDTTTNLGSTTPGASGYTSGANASTANLGTSFSAPIVTAVAALTRSANTKLTPAQVITRLQQSATAFPVVSGIPTCEVPTSASADQIECNCTTTTCGAGIVNANAAVAAAQRPFVIASANPSNPTTGQTVNLTGTASFATDNRTIASYAWTVVSSAGASPALTGANTATASFTASAAGSITLRLTVTDTQGAQDSADITVTTPEPPAPPPSPSPSDSSGGSGGGGGGGAFDLLGLALLAALSVSRFLVNSETHART